MPRLVRFKINPLCLPCFRAEITDLLRIFVIGKKCFNNLNICSVCSVKAIENKRGSYNHPQSLIQICFLKKESKINTNTQIKKHHEYTENSTHLSKYSVPVHVEKIRGQINKISHYNQKKDKKHH